jgi:hypothetical protein
MKYSFEIGSGAMMHIPSLIKITAGILKLMGEGFTNTHTDSMVIS